MQQPEKDAPDATSDPIALVREFASRSGYQVEETADKLKVLVPVGNLRKQIVWCGVYQPQSTGGQVVRFWSVCGPATEKNAVALLRFNAQLAIGAFAYDKLDGQEVIILQTTVPAATMTVFDVARILPALAWQADRVEEQLSGEDIY